jgi:hypothetical protein
MLIGAIHLLMTVLTMRAQAGQIITFGTNSREWNQRLHVSGIRFGCSGMPSACALAAEQTAASQSVPFIYLSVLLKTETGIDYASRYSALSKRHPVIYEVGIDDFFSQLERLSDMTEDAKVAYVTAVAAALKSKNKRLRVGITLYEDQLKTGQIRILQQLGSSIDIVHLFVHFRTNGPLYASYLKTLKTALPKALIYAGAYAYDRIDYLPCAEGSRNPCSIHDERVLFAQTLAIQKHLMDQGEIAAIEFSPGMFGQEDEWRAWTDARTCRAERRQECIDDTKALRQIVLNVLK